MPKSMSVAAFAGAALAVLLSGCVGFEHSSSVVSPTDPAVRSMLGEWAAAPLTSFPTPQSCGGLRWTITSQEANSIAGEFQATCAGGASLTGVASGTIDGNIQFQASGTAAGLGPLTCPFSLTGTGDLQANTTIRVTYSGQTCLGPISGSEVVRR